MPGVGFIYFYLPHFEPEATTFKLSYVEALKDKRMVCIFTYIFLISLLYHGIQQWLGVYFSNRFNLSQFLISMLVTLTSLSGIFGEALGGWLSDIIGRIKVINLGLLLMIVSVSFLIFKLPLIVLTVLMIIWGVGWTFNHAGISTALTDLPQEFLNEAASLNSSLRFLSGGLGVVLSGALMQKNFNLGFLVFGCCLLGLLIFTKFLRPTIG